MAGTLQVIIAIVAAVAAVGASSLLVVAQYQNWRRRKQPVIADVEAWNEVISAQRAWLAHVHTVLRDLSRAPMTPKEVDSLWEEVEAEPESGYETKERLRARLLIQAVELMPAKVPEDSLLGISEGRQAFVAYRKASRRSRNLRDLARHIAYGQRSNGPLNRLAQWSEEQWRRIVRRNMKSYAAKTRRSLTKTHKYLTEISYLQPELLLRPGAKEVEEQEDEEQSRSGGGPARLATAIEQLSTLGDDGVEVRVGGVLALQRIAEDSDRDLPAVVEVLSVFVRTRGQAPNDDGDLALERHRPTPDVQAALTVIGRVHDRHRSYIDLHEAHLERANLARADLIGADLSGANLTGADLSGSDLSGANLVRADLAGAYLGGADLTDAYLAGANLDGAYLIDVDLDGADLSRVDLTGAFR